MIKWIQLFSAVVIMLVKKLLPLAETFESFFFFAKNEKELPSFRSSSSRRPRLMEGEARLSRKEKALRIQGHRSEAWSYSSSRAEP